LSIGQLLGSISNKAIVFFLSVTLSTMGISDNLMVVGRSFGKGITGIG
jgi:hypothetical protein